MSIAASDHLLRVLAAVPVESRILVVGCDDGRHAIPLVQLGFEVYVVDEDETAVEDLRKQLTPLEGIDATKTVVRARPQALGFPDDFFDWVIVYRTLTQSDTPVDDVVDALTEIRRVLVSGGWAYVALDTRSAEEADSEHILGLYGLMQRGQFELAEKAEVIVEEDRRLVRGIFRRVDAATAV